MTDPQMPGAAMSDAVSRVLEFASQTDRPLPPMGHDEALPETQATRLDGQIVARVRGEEVLGIEVFEPIRVPARELGKLITEAVNEALEDSREQTRAQLEQMPGLGEIQANLSALREDVLSSYKQEMARLEDLTKGIAQ